MASPVVVITPRLGVSAEEIAVFLRERFQQPCTVDDGGNPLVNAHVEVVAPQRAAAPGLADYFEGREQERAVAQLKAIRDRFL